MKRNSRSLIFACLSIAGWSTAATAFKIALSQAGTLTVLFLASLTSLLIFLVIERPWKQLPGRIGMTRAFFSGLLNPALYYIILFSAYSRLPAQAAQPLNYTWPLVLTLINAVLLKERIHTREAAGLLISFSGAALISLWNGPGAEQLSGAGIALALGSSLFWALYWVLQKKWASAASSGLFWNFFWGTLILLPLWLGSGGAAELNSGVILSSVWVGVFEMGITFYFWKRALELSTRTARLNQFIYLTPFISLVVITLILREPLRLSTLPGLLLIVGGILFGRKR